MSGSDSLRWSICAALVLMAHGVIAAAIAARSDYAALEAGAPVVMIELAAITVGPPTPQNDLAPGPEQTEPESQARLPQEAKPEEKRIEIERVLDVTPTPDPVALPPPVPEPSKQPEQRAEQEPAPEAPVPTAPPAVEAPAPRPAAPLPGEEVRKPSVAILTWQRTLIAHLQRHKRYPPQARGEQGVASVAFRIDRRGHLLTSRIVRSSGSAVLDEETLAMIKRAAPLPAPPGDIAEAQLSFIVPIRYAASARR
jgi:periplasmic protein TonB